MAALMAVNWAEPSRATVTAVVAVAEVTAVDATAVEDTAVIVELASKRLAHDTSQVLHKKKKGT